MSKQLSVADRLNENDRHAVACPSPSIVIGRPIGPGRQPAVTNSICLVLIRHIYENLF
jgi:hypothetical protein